ncbi:hypothetical protein [Streptomyces sp. C10-9-1]|uniref:hypothetical protein n=1 Tax=Streptomyces sp. C10-9-1 TaxID=1859285 RepID=UPI003F4A8351
MTPNGYKGVVVDGDDAETVARILDAQAAELPVGARVRHRRNGRLGTVYLDSPPNVPGRFDGRPRAHCLGHDGARLVCVSWDNELGFSRWIVWADDRLLDRPDATLPNRRRPRTTTAGAR